MTKSGVYNAGPLFSEAEVNQRKLEGVNLRKHLSDVCEIYNPIDFPFNEDSGVAPDVVIFNGDYELMQKSKYFIFDMDGRDPGTLVEYGLAIEMAIERECYLFAVYSDFRVGRQLSSMWPSYAINSFMSGNLNSDYFLKHKPRRVFAVRKHIDAINTIKAIETNQVIDESKFDAFFDLYKEY